METIQVVSLINTAMVSSGIESLLGGSDGAEKGDLRPWRGIEV